MSPQHLDALKFGNDQRLAAARVCAEVRALPHHEGLRAVAHHLFGSSPVVARIRLEKLLGSVHHLQERMKLALLDDAGMARGALTRRIGPLQPTASIRPGEILTRKQRDRLAAVLIERAGP